ncbi:MAG TPA: hypothetical protein VJ859_02215 [Allosphingosinicella sp.]|nr:hypothetical protein [Allosphingosinicella sp.]
MSKAWKPEIDEDTRAVRRRRGVGFDPDASVRDRMRSLRGGAAPEPKEMVVVIGGGIMLGLLIAFVPALLRPAPGPDWHVSRAEERQLLAQANRVRLGDRTPAVAGDPRGSMVEPRSADASAYDARPDEYDRAVASQNANAPGGAGSAAAGAAVNGM